MTKDELVKKFIEIDTKEEAEAFVATLSEEEKSEIRRLKQDLLDDQDNVWWKFSFGKKKFSLQVVSSLPGPFPLFRGPRKLNVPGGHNMKGFEVGLFRHLFIFTVVRKEEI